MRNRVRNLSSEAIQKARKLRKEMGASERRLWRLLRHKQLGVRFRRQYAIGAYILDFYCPETKVCVELDGDFHANRRIHDEERDKWVAQKGIKTVRVTTWELYKNPEGVIKLIWEVLFKE